MPQTRRRRALAPGAQPLCTRNPRRSLFCFHPRRFDLRVCVAFSSPFRYYPRFVFIPVSFIPAGAIPVAFSPPFRFKPVVVIPTPSPVSFSSPFRSSPFRFHPSSPIRSHSRLVFIPLPFSSPRHSHSIALSRFEPKLKKKKKKKRELGKKTFELRVQASETMATRGGQLWGHGYTCPLIPLARTVKEVFQLPKPHVVTL